MRINASHNYCPIFFKKLISFFNLDLLKHKRKSLFADFFVACHSVLADNYKNKKEALSTVKKP